MKSGFLDLGGRNNNHRKKETNEPVIVGTKETKVTDGCSDQPTKVTVACSDQPTKVTDGLNAGSTKVTAGNLNDGGFANDKYVNKASLESGYTPREDHVEPNVENRRPITTDPSDVQKGPELISYANKLSPSGSTKTNLRKMEANVPNDADCYSKFDDCYY
ncbi:hypothetical protein Tco_1275800 [Tanacetum coccineum]